MEYNHKIMKYNHKIDTVKFGCAVAVVLIHLTAFIERQGIATISNYYIYRYFFNIAVPFFFAASGYIIAIKSDISYIKKHTIKTFIMYSFFSIFYIIIESIFILTDKLFLGKPFWLNLKALYQGITIENIYLGTFGSYHLWFLTALIIGSILFMIALHFKLSANTILLLSFFIYTADLIQIFKLDKLNYYNGTTQAFFYLSLGYFIAKKNIKFRYPLILFLTSMIMYALHTIIFQNSLNNLFLILATFFLLYYCKVNSGKKSIFSSLGKHSLDVYILHVFVYELVYKTLNYIGISSYNDRVWNILLVTLLCVILSVVIFKPLNFILKSLTKNLENIFLE